MDMTWLNSLQNWVKEYPCVLVDLTRDEWNRLSETRRGVGEFTIARSHHFFERVRVPTLCFVFADDESQGYRKTARAPVCMVGKISSRMRISSLETRAKISRAVHLSGIDRDNLASLLGNSIHATNLKDRLSRKEPIVPLSPELSRVLVEAVANDSANSAVLRAVSEGLTKTRTFSGSRALQTDAIQTALRVFGLTGEDGATELQLVEGESSALSSTPLYEDTVIQYDARVVTGFDYTGDITGRAVFESGRKRLEVFTANKLPLERAFGVDLIYLNLAQRNLVMVQYKMLEHDRNDDWIYRPDDKLADEIGRMEKFATVAAGKSSEYRLNDESFYLKFVKRNGLLKNGSILTPLAHFKQIVGAPGSAGSRGGVRISYEQLDGCYMRHSTFIDLFQAGYIGAYSATTTAFQTLIEQVVAGNRSVVAAIQYASSATDDQSYIPPSRYRRP
jgi:hypothetical protein